MPELTVRAALKAGGQVAVEVNLQRPSVARLFRGQTPAFVVQKIGLLYSLCAQAQQAAAAAALAAASGAVPPAADNTLLWTEMLTEDLWRLLLDWPKALGLPCASDSFIAWHRQRHSAKAAALTKSLIDGALRDSVDAALQRLAHASAAEPMAAPAFAPDAWLAHLRGKGGRPPMSPAPSVRAAYLARVAQVARAAQALRDGTPYPLIASADAGLGVAQSLTARGVLTHVARIAGGLVQDYQVWAPTDAWFASPAALQRLLGEQTFTGVDDARQALQQAVLALDPCVAMAVEFDHA